MSVATLGTFTTKRNVRVQKLQGTNCLRIQSKWKKRKEDGYGMVFRYVGSIFELHKSYTSRCGPGSVVGIATGYGLDGPGIESRWRQDFPHLSRPALGVKSGRGVTLTPHPLLVPWSRESTAIPLLPLWAVRPVQSLSDCTRVHFTFTLHITTMCTTWPLFHII
jgi:hypothetical protein